MAEPRIFVNIAAYRDTECQWTVKDLFEKARAPERVLVGLCWQFVEAEDKDCFLVPSPRPDQTRTVAFDAHHSLGACWARHHAETLWQGEDYCLQIDSHMRFAPGWDDRALAELARCPAPKPVLSSYPPAYTPPDALTGEAIIISHAAEFQDNGLVRVASHRIEIDQAPKQPVPTPFIAGGFVFGASAMLREVPYDPHLYFWGEELTLAARLWTHGWNIFVPSQVICWHDYSKREGRRRHWDDHKEWTRLNELSQKRARHLLGAESVTDPEALREIERYGLGTARSLEQFYAHSGVDYRAKTIHGKSIEQVWMEQPAEERRKRHQEVFAAVQWGAAETRSGPGSTLAATEKIRAELPDLFDYLGIEILADAGCGDCNWMSRISERLTLYLGLDVVGDLVRLARERHGRKRGHLFSETDITLDPPPRADAILCRDVLTHLPALEVKAALALFKDSGARYLIATHFERDRNEPVRVGGWQPMALTAPPYALPPPRHLLREGLANSSKSLGVWLLKDVPV
jgi:hypothetical protein